MSTPDAKTQTARRSSRANKGKNTRLEEERRLEEELAQSARKKAKLAFSTSKLEGTAENDSNNNSNNQSNVTKVFEEVRCLVCGAIDSNYDEDNDTLGTMIECESCLTWQHAKCLLGHANKKKIPSSYKCEVCSPELYPNIRHKIPVNEYFDALLKSGVSTRTNWQNRIFDKSDLAGSVQSFTHAQPKDSQNNDDDHNNTKGSNNDVDDEDIEDQKDKADLNDEEYEDAETKSSKPRKSKAKSTVKPKSKSKAKEKEKSPSPETKVRDVIVKQFQKVFTDYLVPELEPNSKKPSKHQDHDSKEWATDLEKLLYNNFNDVTNKNDPGAKYRDKFRNLFAALRDKKNTALRKRLINKDLTPEEFINLKNEELINPDLQKFREDSIKQKIAENTLKPVSQVQIIQKTHKGELVLEEEVKDYHDDGLLSFSDMPKVSNDISNNDNKKANPTEENGDTNDKNNKDETKKEENEAFTVGLDTEKDSTPSSIDAQSKEDSLGGNTHNMTFSYNDEVNDKMVDVSDDGLSDIIGTDDEYDPTQQPGMKHEEHSNDTKEINNGSFNGKIPEIAWKGTIHYAETPTLLANMVFLGNSDTEDSATASNDTAFTLFEPYKPVQIAGRLDKWKAEKYLIQVAKTRNLIITEIKPGDGEPENVEKDTKSPFNRLFTYFKSKLRYGVINLETPSDIVKDAYLIPLDTKIKEDLPEFLQTMENFRYDYSGLPRLFMVFTVKKRHMADRGLVNENKLLLSRPHFANGNINNNKNNDDSNRRSSTSSHSRENKNSGSSGSGNEAGKFLQTLLTSLTPDQVKVLEQVIMNNPQAKQDPQQLMEAITKYNSTL